ncbi:MAG TPA: hypothetical protein ENO23_06785, partial [Alphaproteobacteria bacterium]|nr:hypothetical protein [Alphaproteobacteria bacterium]
MGAKPRGRPRDAGAAATGRARAAAAPGPGQRRVRPRRPDGGLRGGGRARARPPRPGGRRATPGLLHRHGHPAGERAVSTTFDAFRFPTDVPLPAELETWDAGRLTFRYPAPAPELIEPAVRALRAAGRALSARPVAEIVGVIDAAANRLADPADPLRQQAERLVPEATGYSPEQARLVLDRMTADWRAPALHELLRAELGDPSALDGFVTAGPTRRTRAYGARLAFHVFAGNVPGVAVTSLIRSLLVKSPVLGKLGSGEPVLPVLFAEAVASVDAAVADALALTYWPGGSQDAEWRACEAADLVVVYGGDEAVASFRERVPERDRLVVHGPRFSV